MIPGLTAGVRTVPCLTAISICVLVASCGERSRPECITPELPDATVPASVRLVPDQVESLWEAGPHALSHRIENGGPEPSCARCHAPLDWLPENEGDLPASWLAQGIALAGLEPSPRSGWRPIGCAVCHQGETDLIDGEIAWLEIPPITGYVPVESPTDLCQKCHQGAEVEGHTAIIVEGSHRDMECTTCHDPHDTSASCSGSGCHEPFALECESIETHDKPHREASCSSCHDSSGLEIGWNESAQVWDTLNPATTGGGEDRAFSSHSLILQVACERCHEPGNHPWGETKE